MDRGATNSNFLTCHLPDSLEFEQVDNLLPKYHAIRVDRLRTRKEKVVKILPPRTGVAGAGPAGSFLGKTNGGSMLNQFPNLDSKGVCV